MLEGPDLLHQPLPLDRSILWKPGVEGGGGGTGLIPDSIFVAQAAVAALREHAGSAPEKSLLGFLVGDLCQTPDTATRYILVGSLIRVTQPVQGDRTTIVVKALWDRVRAEVKKAGRRLLGWYHTHQDLGIELSSYDVETHERYFTEPWQVAVVIGTAEGEPAAGFYRSGGDESWAATCLPFYEVLKDESLGEGGKKRSYVVWKNYRAFNAVSDRTTRVMSVPRQDAIPPPPRRPAPPPPVAAPEERDEEPEERDEEPEEREEEPEEREEEPEEREEEPEEREEEPDDRNELRFLSAADDMLSRHPPAPSQWPPPPPPPPAPPAPPAPPPLPPLPRRQQAAAWRQPAAPTPTSRRTAPAAIPRRKRRRWGRVAVLGLVVLGGVGGALYYWRFGLPPQLLRRGEELASRARQTLQLPHATTVPASPALARLDALADSLAQAVRNYDDRARLYDKRQLDCPSLGRGIIAVERRLVAYGVQRAAVRGALDAGRVSRERAQRASVDAAERQFRQSQCPRP